MVAISYALSPIDLIRADFIPVLGILDDLILLPGLLDLDEICLLNIAVASHTTAGPCEHTMRSMLAFIKIFLFRTNLAHECRVVK